MEKLLLDAREAADALGIGLSKFLQVAVIDGIRPVRIGRRRLYPAQAIRDYAIRLGSEKPEQTTAAS